MAVIAGGVVVAAAGAASGTLDPGFGNAGVTISATAPGAGGDFQNGLAIQPDRRIVVGGESDLGEAAAGLQWRISRYTHKGEPDVGFGTGGTVTTSMSSVGGQDEILWNLDVQPDGKIVAAGDAATASGGMDVALARFNVNGTLDMSFAAAWSTHLLLPATTEIRSPRTDSRWTARAGSWSSVRRTWAQVPAGSISFWPATCPTGRSIPRSTATES